MYRIHVQMKWEFDIRAATFILRDISLPMWLHAINLCSFLFITIHDMFIYFLYAIHLPYYMFLKILLGQLNSDPVSLFYTCSQNIWTFENCAVTYV
ncbi:hypothetical protein ACJX0J_026591, partial [Zea mays]